MAKGLKQKTSLTLSFLTVFVGLIFKVRITKTSAIECGTTGDLEIPLIVGGQKTLRGEWPFLAALFLVDEFFCGGSLISTKHILTAAHCVNQKGFKVPLLPVDIAVLLGAYDLTQRNKTNDDQLQRNVSEILIHPDWKVDSDKYDADISILVLSENISFTKYIRPVCMPADDTVIYDAMGYIVGWGCAENGLRPHIEFPKSALIMSLKDSYCYTTNYATALISSQRTFCGRGEGQSPSSGDSGGGFFVLSSSSAWVQCGIISTLHSNRTGATISTSHSNRTGHMDVDSIAIYTNIKWFKSWIIETVRQSGGAVMTVNESNKSKITLDCHYGFTDYGTYGCWLYDLDIRSKNVEIASFSGTHTNKKTDEDVNQIQFTNGTMFFLPNEVGIFFKNLNRLDIGYTGSSRLKTKHIRRSNFENLHGLVALKIANNDIETLVEDTLWDLPNLEIFELSNNSLKVIDEKTFEKNPKLRRVSLNLNQLELVPRSLFQNNLLLEVVSFSGNKIKEIHENTFEKNTKLRLIHLHSNELEFLPRNLFQNNLLLEEVQFSENKLKEIDEKTFDKNTKLRKVYMYTNPLEFFPRNLFQNNVLLEEVSFFENNIKEIDEKSFEKNTNLRHVYLYLNQLEFLPSNLFQNNLLLETVSLHHNKIKEINEKTFEKNRKLKIVDLDSIQLEFLPNTLFQNNLLLEGVDLSENKITEIDERTFEKNTKLTHVFLSSNQLELLPWNLFQNNLLLEVVDFSRNSLNKIEIKFSDFKYFRHIFLFNNVCIDAYYDGTNDPTEYPKEIRDLTEFQTLVNGNCSSAN